MKNPYPHVTLSHHVAIGEEGQIVLRSSEHRSHVFLTDVLTWLADVGSVAKLIEELPTISDVDVRASLLFAAEGASRPSRRLHARPAAEAIARREPGPGPKPKPHEAQETHEQKDTSIMKEAILSAHEHLVITIAKTQAAAKEMREYAIEVRAGRGLAPYEKFKEGTASDAALDLDDVANELKGQRDRLATIVSKYSIP